jgi:hypothetical protein
MEMESGTDEEMKMVEELVMEMKMEMKMKKREKRRAREMRNVGRRW